MKSRVIGTVMVTATWALPLVAAEQPGGQAVNPYSFDQVDPTESPWVIVLEGKRTDAWEIPPTDVVRSLREKNKLPAYLEQRDGLSIIYVVDGYKSLRHEKLQKQLQALKKDKSGSFRRAFAAPHPRRNDVLLTANKLPAVPGEYNVGKYNIFKCKGPWTLKVASFKGFSGKRANQSAFTQRKQYGVGQRIELKNDLVKAAKDAEKLTERLRKTKFEAYVVHGYYDSYVTLGSFATSDDPRIKKLSRKWLEHPLSRSLGVLRLQPMLITVPKKSSKSR